MSSALALAVLAHIVSVTPSELASKPVFVRIGLVQESRVTLPEPLRRLHGRQADAEAVGLVVREARPRTVFSFRPRRATTARFLVLGHEHGMELIVEATAAGTAQDVELHVRAPETASPPVAAAPPGDPSGLASNMPSTTAPATATVAEGDSAPARPTLLEASAAVPPRSPSTGDSVPEARADTPPLNELPLTPRAPATSQPARGCWLTGPPVTHRPGRRITRPGQHTVVVEELAREAHEVRVRLRIEGAARCAQVRHLLIAGVLAEVTVTRQGRDLVVVGVAPPPPDCTSPGIRLALEDGRRRSVALPLAPVGLVARVAQRGAR